MQLTFFFNASIYGAGVYVHRAGENLLVPNKMQGRAYFSLPPLEEGVEFRYTCPTRRFTACPSPTALRPAGNRTQKSTRQCTTASKSSWRRTPAVLFPGDLRKIRPLCQCAAPPSTTRTLCNGTQTRTRPRSSRGLGATSTASTT